MAGAAFIFELRNPLTYLSHSSNSERTLRIDGMSDWIYNEMWYASDSYSNEG